MNIHDFYVGKAFDAYEYFGAHAETDGVVFRTYAPNARAVWLIGEFNGWQEDPMIQEGKSGVFMAFSREARPGMMYKFKLLGQDGTITDHCDPYGFGMELRPNNASIIRDLSEYTFKDSAWMKKRDKNYNQPLNIYELHLGSWKTDEERENGWYRYCDIADELIAYVKENKYTHIEFLPLSEHPADCSWGYQNTGFFSPTSRYGTCRDFMELVDKCHQKGIGVIMDFVPVHFAIDDYALAKYDGTNLYEYPDSDVGVSEWGTRNFNFARGETRSFLQSAANYWLKEYHVDGIRMDAISRAIYWIGDPNRGVNQCSVDFIKGMNDGLHRLHPDVMLIAEDSTNFLKVTAPVAYEGIGFDYKWDMGWMNDTLEYFKIPPKERSAHYHKLTFSMHYFYNELFLLPLSHDEVVHGKATIIQKMWGDYEDKFLQCRAFYMYMYTHPGKKLNFMGNELGQFREWDEKREQDWNLLEYPIHDAFHRYMITLHETYAKEKALHENEYDQKYFSWIEANGVQDCVYAYQRGAGLGAVVCVFNFSDEEKEKYRLIFPEAVSLKEILNSDWEEFAGSTKKKRSYPVKSKVNSEGEHEVLLDIPRFCGRMFRLANS